jgi:hypothetical protein
MDRSKSVKSVAKKNFCKRFIIVCVLIIRAITTSFEMFKVARGFQQDWHSRVYPERRRGHGTVAHSPVHP